MAPSGAMNSSRVGRRMSSSVTASRAGNNWARYFLSLPLLHCHYFFHRHDHILRPDPVVLEEL